MTHHENMDGSGYPNGLTGEDIPLFGRITAICDVFDALVSERPYKKAWSTDEAISHMRDMAGSKFDARLLDLFIGILDEIMEIHDNWSDAST